jgi:putative peptidoglycan lipid II flippase
MKSSGQKILRSTALVMLLSVLGKATGLIREIIVAAQFGTSEQMDAFLVAATIVSLIFVWIRSPIRVALVPFLMEERSAHGEHAAWQKASVIINTITVLLIALAIIGWVVSPYLVWLVAPGFTDETKSLSADLTRLMILTIVFLGVAKLLSAVFHSYQRFGWPGMMSSVDNLVIIPFIIVLTPVVGVHGLAISIVLGTLAQALIQTSILWKNRFYYRARVDFKDPTLHRMGSMGFPLLVGTGSTKLASIIDRVFASMLRPGSLSALSYGHRLTYVTLELFVESFTTVLFPFFSRIAGSEGYQDFGKKLAKSLKTLFWIGFPVSMGILVIHESLVRLVYQRGAFSEESVLLTSQAVLFYAVGLWAFSISHVLSFAFYSLKDTKTPVVLGIVRLGIKILLSFALIGPMAHAGLALAESISYIIKAICLLLFLPTELKGEFEYRALLQSFGMTAVITAGMGAMVFFILPIFEGLSGGGSFVASSAGLGGTVLLGAAAYLTCSSLLQPAELKDVYKLVRTGLAKR